MNAPTTRDLIVAAADRLIYEGGFEHMSFARIAEAVGISRGNFYYHFKAKDEILAAVIAARHADTAAMLDGWEQAGTGPEQRLLAFIHMLIANRAAIGMFGCPVGTLCGELAKLGHPSHGAATGLFTLFRQWLALQFMAAGAPSAVADELAMHLLARSQGIATLASAFRDEAFIETEARQLQQWLSARIAEFSCPA